MSYAPNNWGTIRRFYKRMTPLILNAKSNEWAIPPYEWEECGGITFTPIETALWHDIRAASMVMYPQYPVLEFFVDFANPVAKVAIECDGKEFHNTERDARRDQKLRLDGWTVYRITGKDCKTDFEDETLEAGAARDFINAICENHNVVTG